MQHHQVQSAQECEHSMRAGTRARSLSPAAQQPPKDAGGGPEPLRTSTMTPMDCVFNSFSITGLSARKACVPS
jgi:hypothetical protein